MFPPISVYRKARRNSINIIEQVFENFRRYGELEYGERVNMREHMLQTATFAERDGASPTLIAAAVLHDYGHLIHGLPEDIANQGIDGQHEEVGARALEPYFTPAVTELLRLHVAAKRNLCATDPAYFAALSPASVQSLAVQGGPFSEAEVVTAKALWEFTTETRRTRRFNLFYLRDLCASVVGSYTVTISYLSAI